MNRTKKTTINVIINMSSTILTSIASFIMIRLVLDRMSSDYNGLNQTVAQLIFILTIFESSFTSAALIALYEPYIHKRKAQINLICSTARYAFERSGGILFVGGILFAFIYSIFLKTDYNYFVVVLVFAISIMSTVVSSLVALKYRLLFQVTQTEYIVNFINTLGNLLAHATAYFYLLRNNNILHLRMIYTTVAIMITIVIAFLGKRRFPYVDFSLSPDFTTVKGTKDLIVSSSTGAIYKSVPFLFISSFAGTVQTSVYSVYSSIFGMVENFSYAIFSAPRNGIGQMISEGNTEKIKMVFREFEHLCFLVMSIMITIVGTLIIPFIKLYTSGVSDAQYVDYLISYSMIIATFIQFIHMPSGQFISMSGHFKAVRDIQLLAASTLIVLDIIGVLILGVYGILAANVLTGIMLAILEVRYMRKKILHICYSSFFRLLIVYGGITIMLIWGFTNLFMKSILNYFQLLYYGIFISLLSVITFGGIGFVLFRLDMMALVFRIKSLIGRSEKSHEC